MQYDGLLFVEREVLFVIVDGAYAGKEGVVHADVAVELGEEGDSVVLNLGHLVAVVALVECEEDIRYFVEELAAALKSFDGVFEGGCLAVLENLFYVGSLLGYTFFESLAELFYGVEGKLGRTEGCFTVAQQGACVVAVAARCADKHN